MSSVGRHVKYSEEIIAIRKKYSRNNFHTLNICKFTVHSYIFFCLKCETLQLMSSVGRHVKCSEEIIAIGKKIQQK